MFCFASFIPSFLRRNVFGTGPKLRSWMWPAVGAMILSTQIVDCSKDDKKGSDKAISKTHLLKELSTRMENLQKNNTARNNLNPNGPDIKIRVEGRGKDEVHVLEIGKYDEKVMWDILFYWMEVLGPGAVELHSITDAEGIGKLISFVSSSGKSSLVITVGTSGGKMSIFKDGGFTGSNLDMIVKGYVEAHKGSQQRQQQRGRPGFGGRTADEILREFMGDDNSVFMHEPQAGQEHGSTRAKSSPSASPDDPMAQLESLGVTVYTNREGDPDRSLSWDSLAGYSAVKQEIKDSVLTPLLHPDIYDAITQYTRESPSESNRPKAVLLEGPPGTGKTLTARIIARESDRPMVHLPVESIASKWYGESEKKLSQVRSYRIRCINIHPVVL
jgi:SpoVK/Ycf46/Vps4 family AAA+-type ATPase